MRRENGAGRRTRCVAERGGDDAECPFSRYALRSKFYVSLTRSHSLPAAEKLLNGMEGGFLWTGIGPAATGILGVFPGCTSRQCCMYIYPPRKSLIANIEEERVRTGCISSLFLHTKIIHFLPLSKRRLTTFMDFPAGIFFSRRFLLAERWVAFGRALRLPNYIRRAFGENSLTRLLRLVRMCGGGWIALLNVYGVCPCRQRSRFSQVFTGGG